VSHHGQFERLKVVFKRKQIHACASIGRRYDSLKHTTMTFAQADLSTCDLSICSMNRECRERNQWSNGSGLTGLVTWSLSGRTRPA
jgi:hypothetical protein